MKANDISKLANQVSNQYENFCIECLKTYGVTKDNIMDFKDRVRFIEAPMPMSIGSNIRHFYVDDAYVFSIISFYSNIQTDGSTYMQNIKFIRTVI